jgi:hypothetical protein
VPARDRETVTLQRKVLEIERDQTADLARVDNAIALAEVRISALKRRQLGSEELRRKTSDVRDWTILAVRDVRRNMAKRAIAAKNMRESLTKSLRQRSRFDIDTVTDAHLRARFFATLERTPTRELLGRFLDATKIGDLARAESIRFEFQTRDDPHEFEITSAAIFAKLARSDPANMAKRLANICRAVEMADARITSLVSFDPIACLE